MSCDPRSSHSACNSSVSAHLAIRPVCSPICQHFVRYANWTKCRQIGQNVGRWNVPSADVPSADWAKCNQIIPSHLPMARLQIGQNLGRWGDILAGGMSRLLTSRLQIGQNVARWDRPICRWLVCILDKISADWAKCWQM